MNPSRKLFPSRPFALALLGLLAFAIAACDDKKTYPVTFTCTHASPECPQAQSCPTVPLDAGGCEELPGLFGNPTTPVESGRVPGCEVGLSYGNPFYADTQQTCLCGRPPGGADGGAPQWQCGI